MNDLSEEINNKMNQLLDTQLKICYEYSSIVMLTYKQLLSMFSTVGIDDMSCYSDTIEELKEYIKKEYDTYEKLLLYDQNTLMPKLDTLIMDKSDSMAYMRFRIKLQFIKNIFWGYKITARELSIDKISDYFNFDIYAVLLAAINVKTFVSINDKINLLSFDNDRDKEFIISLQQELILNLMQKICSNDLFEMISLNYNFDVDTFPDISMDVLKKQFKKLIPSKDEDICINEVMFNLAIKDLSDIENIQQVKNCPHGVFEYLYIINRLEIIMLYMNKTYLRKMYNYCDDNHFNNTYIKEDVKKKIKRILDVEK